MNILLKSAIAGALALGASSAFALSAPSTNNSDLILVIENSATHAAYALDTGISINSVLPTGSLHSGATLDASLPGVTGQSFAPTATLTSFLAANPIAGDGFEIEGGQYNSQATNGVLKVPGGGKMIISSLFGTINSTTVTGKTVGNLQSFLPNYNQDVTSGFNGTPGLSPLTGTDTGTANSGTTQEAKYGFFTANDNGAVGQSLQLFGFTGNGTTGKLQSYILGTATLAQDGTLTLAGNGGNPPPVPLPAAVWLFGSGLMGLVGISRRRKSTAG